MQMRAVGNSGAADATDPLAGGNAALAAGQSRRDGAQMRIPRDAPVGVPQLHLQPDTGAVVRRIAITSPAAAARTQAPAGAGMSMPW
jgi:hypothetical protein